MTTSEVVDKVLLEVRRIEFEGDDWEDTWAAQIGNQTSECTESKECAVRRAVDRFLGGEQGEYCKSHGTSNQASDK